jgi:hypothetical protein
LKRPESDKESVMFGLACKINPATKYCGDFMIQAQDVVGPSSLMG